VFPGQRQAVSTLYPQNNSGALPIPNSLQDAELSNPLRRLAFYAALGLIFLRYSLLHEVIGYYAGTSTYILYLFAIPALLGVIGCGGVQRTLAAPQAKYWIAFVVWFLLAVPFSTWRGESTEYALLYLRTDMPMLFVMAGLALTWQECRAMLATIAFAGITNIFMGLALVKDFSGRMGIEFGVVSNPNDYAGHLILILPVILFLVLCPTKRMPMRLFVRVSGLAAVLFGLYIIVMTGSRGAFIGLVAGTLYVLWKSSMSVRLGALFAAPLLYLVLFAVVPERIRTRLQLIDFGNSIQKDDSGVADEADESSRLRRFLLDESLRITVLRPIFGVGPGQFGNYEGRAALWRSTHNSFTQISSECGIPALLFYLAALVSGFRTLQRTWKEARRGHMREIEIACYCLSLSFIMFCVAVFFLNFAYFFYFPATVGLFIAVNYGAQRELALAKLPQNHVRTDVIQAGTGSPQIVAPAYSRSPQAFRFNRFR